MSSYIVDKIVAVKLPKAASDDYDDSFILCMLGGSSNCFDGSGRNARRCRSWQAQAIGHAYEVIGEACKMAGECEGGMVKMAGSSHTSPESFIKRCRTALAEAVPFDAQWDMAEVRVKLSLTLSRKLAEGDAKWAYDKAIDAGITCTETEDGGTLFDFNINDKAQLGLWLTIRNSVKYPRHSVIVTGDGEV